MSTRRELERLLSAPVESARSLGGGSNACNSVVGNPHVVRRCRWWLVADAYASLAGQKARFSSPDRAFSSLRRAAPAPLHCQPAALISITTNMREAHRHPAKCSCDRTRNSRHNLPTRRFWRARRSRWPARRRPKPSNGYSIRISRPRKCRCNEPTGGVARFIKLIQLDDLAVDQRHPAVHAARQFHVVGCDQHRYPGCPD